MCRLLVTALILASNMFSAASAESLLLEARSDYTSTCTEIAQAISNAAHVANIGDSIEAGKASKIAKLGTQQPLRQVVSY